MRFKKIFTTILVVMTLIVIASIGLAASALSETYAFRADYNYSIHDATKLQRIIAQIEKGTDDVKIYYPEGLNPTRKNVLDKEHVEIISGGRANG